MPISIHNAKTLLRQLIQGLGAKPSREQLEATMEALMRRPRNFAEAQEWVRDIVGNQEPWPTPAEIHRRTQRAKEGRGKKAAVGCRACVWTGFITSTDGAAPCPHCRRPQPTSDRRTDSAERELAYEED